MKNTYWNNNGKYQKIVDLFSDFNFEHILDSKDQKEYKKITRQYYRYFNDGDSHYTIRNNAHNEGLTVEEYLENKVNELLRKFKIKYGL